jgi:hypothetical protein
MADEPVREMTEVFDSSRPVGGPHEHDMSGLKIADQARTGTGLTKGRRRKPQQRPA